MNSTAETETSMPRIELAKYLWEEYRYRHDLIWRLLFRMTAVAALLSLAPLTIDDLVKRQVGAWVNALPGLTLAFVLISWAVLYLELRLFEPIDARYVEAQNRAVGQAVRRPKKWDAFKWIVYLYPPILAVLVLIVAVLAWSGDP
jgi:hypothetical protein